jgi:hypothetical protein
MHGWHLCDQFTFTCWEFLKSRYLCKTSKNIQAHRRWPRLFSCRTTCHIVPNVNTCSSTPLTLRNYAQVALLLVNSRVTWPDGEGGFSGQRYGRQLATKSQFTAEVRRYAWQKLKRKWIKRGVAFTFLTAA